MIGIEDLRLLNETTIIYKKKLGQDVRRSELISEIISDDACFFKLKKTDAYDILEEIGVGKGKISKIYSRLICQDEYLKLEKAGKIIKNETVLNLDDLYNIDIFKKHKDNNTKESKEITVIKKGIFDRILNVIKKIFKR